MRKLSNGGQRRNMPQAAQVAQVLLFRLVRSAIFTVLGEEVWQQKRLGSACSISLSLSRNAGPDKSKTLCNNSPGQRQHQSGRWS